MFADIRAFGREMMAALRDGRRAAALFFALIVSSSGHAAATDDSKKLDSCLEASGASEKAVVACVDFLHCNMNGLCRKRELDAWQQRVDKAVKDIETSDPSTRNSLENAQSKWRQSLSSLCRLFENRDPGLGLSADFCRARETAIRALDLEQLGYAVGEH